MVNLLGVNIVVVVWLQPQLYIRTIPKQIFSKRFFVSPYPISVRRYKIGAFIGEGNRQLGENYLLKIFNNEFRNRNLIVCRHKVKSLLKNRCTDGANIKDKVFQDSLKGKLESEPSFEEDASVHMVTDPETSDFENQRVTIIIPTLNEAKNIESIITELRRLGLQDILIIDGHSTDRTIEIVETLGINVLRQNGKGKGSALRQAFSYDDLGNWIIMLDADGSMRPTEIAAYLSTLRSGADVAKGSRFMPGGYSEDMTFFRKVGNSFFVFLVNIFFEAKYTDLCFGYAAFRKEALQKLNSHLKSKSFEIESEIFIKTKKLGLRVVEVPSIELRRKSGKSNLHAIRDGFKILRTILREAFW